MYSQPPFKPPLRWQGTVLLGVLSLLMLLQIFSALLVFDPLSILIIGLYGLSLYGVYKRRRYGNRIAIGLGIFGVGTLLLVYFVGLGPLFLVDVGIYAGLLILAYLDIQFLGRQYSSLGGPAPYNQYYAGDQSSPSGANEYGFQSQSPDYTNQTPVSGTATRYCDYCGHDVTGKMFCGKCGQPVTEAS